MHPSSREGDSTTRPIGLAVLGLAHRALSIFQFFPPTGNNLGRSACDSRLFPCTTTHSLAGGVQHGCVERTIPYSTKISPPPNFLACHFYLQFLVTVSSLFISSFFFLLLTRSRSKIRCPFPVFDLIRTTYYQSSLIVTPTGQALTVVCRNCTSDRSIHEIEAHRSLNKAVLSLQGRALATMSGKMTLYKLVVLGDGGVGKTALTIQVRNLLQLPWDRACGGRLTWPID